jgi:hypothetical protein
MKSLTTLERRINRVQKKAQPTEQQVEFEVYWGDEELPPLAPGEKVIVLDFLEAIRGVQEESQK